MLPASLVLLARITLKWDPHLLAPVCPVLLAGTVCLDATCRAGAACVLLAAFQFKDPGYLRFVYLALLALFACLVAQARMAMEYAQRAVFQCLEVASLLRVAFVLLDPTTPIKAPRHLWHVLHAPEEPIVSRVVREPKAMEYVPLVVFLLQVLA